MTDERIGRLVILSGPSCVGKSPLVKALAKFYPELQKTLQPLVLYNSRAARPGEIDGVDYHFRSREQVEKLKANCWPNLTDFCCSGRDKPAECIHVPTISGRGSFS
jgi:guanylate kinase